VAVQVIEQRLRIERDSGIRQVVRSPGELQPIAVDAIAERTGREAIDGQQGAAGCVLQRDGEWPAERFDPRSSFAYQDANFGYDGRYVAQDEYNYYFREGFQRGYEDGYYGRRKYGSGGDDNNEWWIAAGVIGAILAIQAIND
jgi:hypothetical protein